MRILYMSCHSILEWDELRLFTQLGYECYSLGAYTKPGDQDQKRPALDLPYDLKFIDLASRFSKDHLHWRMLDGVDVVIVMHLPKWVNSNWPLFKEFIDIGGRVIWRSIGQSIPHVEEQLAQARSEGLELVRYSPEEESITSYLGSDALIPFYKDPDDFLRRSRKPGKTKPICINFTQSLTDRYDHVGGRYIKAVFAGVPGRVYGPNNTDLGDIGGGYLTHEEQRQVLAEARCYFHTGTYPASYTLSFIEAWMAGLPVVAVGPILGNGSMFVGQSTYSIHHLIEDGVTGYVSEDLEQIRQRIRHLLDNPQDAYVVGQAGRIRAIEIFGKAVVGKLWREYLG